MVHADFRIGAHLQYIAYHLAWELYSYPRIIDIRTGKVMDEIKNIDSGAQRSSIVLDSVFPTVVFSRKTRQVAIAGNGTIEVLTNDLLPG